MTGNRFLLVQLADIGDLVLTTPAISALREARPQAQIDLFASRHALPVMPPALVNHIIPFDKDIHSATRALLSSQNLRRLLSLRQGNYDTVIFFHHFTLNIGVTKFRLIARAARAERIVGLKNRHVRFLTDYVVDEGFGVKHEAQYWLELVALVGASSRPRPAQIHRETCLDVSDSQKQAGGGHRAAPQVVIHAGSGGYSTARRWIPKRFAAVARQLREQYDAEIILVGKNADDSCQVARMMGREARNLVGKTSLPQLADVIYHADLFIGADSGVMHIAAATGTPVISIFGPSNFHAWRPWSVGSRAAVLTGRAACSPCSYVGHNIGARDGCPARTCMKLVSQQTVSQAAKRILDNHPAQPDAPPAYPQAAQRTAARTKILGVPVDAIAYDQWMEQIRQWVRHSRRPHHVCTVNPEFIMLARQDPIFFNILNRADLCVPDGVGLLWASRLLGSPIAQRVTGSDGVPLIAAHAAKHGWRIFFLGAASGIAEKAAAVLRQGHPGLQVAGSYAGSPAEAEEDHIVSLINGSAADILLVAYGAPAQDKWIARNLPRLHVKMAMGIGGSLDFIAGTVPRAPVWMRENGLEWLYRLIRQPWRLRRMLRLPRFVIAVLRRRHSQSDTAD